MTQTTFNVGDLIQDHEGYTFIVLAVTSSDQNRAYRSGKHTKMHLKLLNNFSMDPIVVYSDQLYFQRMTKVS